MLWYSMIGKPGERPSAGPCGYGDCGVLEQAALHELIICRRCARLLTTGSN